MPSVSDARKYTYQNVRLPAPLKRKLARRATSTGMTETFIIRAALEHYLDGGK